MAKQLASVVGVFILLCCFIHKTNAQQQEYFPNIQYITSNEGLSHNEVTAILQDRKGFLWVGTRGGLNRYDGSNFKVFQNEIGNSNSLVGDSVESLFEDSKGHIWIGTKSNGVSRYIPELDLFEHIVPSPSPDLTLPDDRVISIAESSTNEIWLGTWNNGITIYNPKNNTSRKKLSMGRIFDILKAKDNRMWVVSASAIRRYSEDEEDPKHFSEPNHTSILEDDKTGYFYFGSYSKGLTEFNVNTEIFEPYLNPENKASNNAYTLFQDNKRNIWIGTYNDAVSQFNLETKTFTNYDLIANSTQGGTELYKDVLTIYQDRLGILWFGTNGGGLCKVGENSDQFGNLTIINTKTSLPNEPIWSVLKGNEDLLLVGIRGDDNLYYSKDSKTFSKFKLPKIEKNKKDGIKAIYQDNDGTYWFGGNYKSLIFKLKNTKKDIELKPINFIDSLKFSKITAFYQTKNGHFWIGSQQNGLRKSIAPGNPENQLFEQLLEKERISAFLEDKAGNFWVGTYNGLQLYDSINNEFKRFSENRKELNSLSSDIILCIYEDKNEELWIGTPNGLNLAVKNKDETITFKLFKEEDGLPNNYVHAILEDDKGNLWISTDKGISRFNIENNSFYNYDVNDGVQSKGFMEGSAFKGKNGTLYFGGKYGLNTFHPDSILNDPAPSVVLTGLKISGEEIRPGTKHNNRNILKKSIAYTDKIVLTHNENIFSLEYTTIGFHGSRNYTYSYRMEPQDDWVSSSSQNSATYSNLDPGNYIFKVRGIGDDPNTDTNETHLKITVLPPFWKTWQAFVLYTLLFVGLLYSFKYIITEQSVLKNNLELEKLERRKEEELTKMKTQFFTDIAHEFRTPLSLISGPVETLLENGLNEEQRKGQLSTIQYHTKRLLSLIGQLLDFRKAESGKMKLQVATGNFAKFTNEIFLSFKDLAESKNVQFNLNLENKHTPLTYDRGKMEIVLCNLLSNAFKYTETKIDLGLSIKGVDSLSPDFLSDFELGYCEISVIDNGKGMSEDATERIFDRFYQISNSETINKIGTGIGLALVKNIVELHKGRVFVNSELNNGSQFIIQLPLGETHYSKDQFISDFKKAEDPVHYQVERILSDFSETTIKTDSDLPMLLIVEDNPEIRSYIKIIFQNTYKVIEAENGLIGLEKALQYIPQIIITDLMMPKMDGMTLCRELREKDETLHIPIIMLTARTTQIFEEKGYNAGADIFVTKPFNPSILKVQVEGLLKSRTKLKDYFGKKITLLPTELDHTSVDEEFLNKVMKLVEDNLTNDRLNREFLASKMAVSPSTLYRKIKSITELDITIFIRSIRLKRAAQMIQNKEDNISGIAYHVGFNDPKYFRKCFIKQFGVTPSKFGKNI